MLLLEVHPRRRKKRDKLTVSRYIRNSYKALQGYTALCIHCEQEKKEHKVVFRLVNKENAVTKRLNWKLLCKVTLETWWRWFSGTSETVRCLGWRAVKEGLEDLSGSLLVLFSIIRWDKDYTQLLKQHLAQWRIKPDNIFTNSPQIQRHWLKSKL